MFLVNSEICRVEELRNRDWDVGSNLIVHHYLAL